MKKKRSIPATSEQQSDLLLAAKVASRVEAMDIRIASTNTRHNPLAVLGDSIRFITKSLQYKVDRESAHILVKPHFVLEMDYEGSNDCLMIEAEFLIIYSVQSLDELSDDNIDAFADKNGLYNCWPYWREYVQSMTARLGVRTTTLPPFRPTDTQREIGKLARPDRQKRIPKKTPSVTKAKASKKKKRSRKKK